MRANVLFIGLIACGTTSSLPSSDDADGSVVATPFAEQPDTSEGLTNVSADLDALLENGALQGACDAYWANPDDSRQKLLCGKSMFFDEGFGTIGIPEAIVDFMGTELEAEIGTAFTGYGMIEDPRQPGRPLGLGPGAPLDGTPTLAMTCASCHFAQLPDGRYAVGAPNTAYDYGTHMLALTLVPGAAAPDFDRGAHHPDAVAAVAPLLDRVSSDTLLQMRLGLALLPLMNIDAVGMDRETEGFHAAWKPGTMDFAIAPLPIDDEVHTVSKIGALYSIPSREEEQASGMPHAMLAWTGNARSLEDFLRGFVTIGNGDHATWNEDTLEPLAAYIYSLRAPVNPSLDADAAARGETAFGEAGCADCHSGPRGGGTRLYDYEEVGTDAAMMLWGDADLDGTPCCDMDDGVTTFDHQVKSPRLVGLWAMERFLHNGSVESLDALLCLDGARPTIEEEPFSDRGHLYGCDLDDGTRRDLVAFLESH